MYQGHPHTFYRLVPPLERHHSSSPFLFTIYTADFSHNYTQYFLQKFSDDSPIVGLITDVDDKEKGQSRLYLLWGLRSFGVKGPLLKTFYDSVVASAIFYGVVCWSGSISAWLPNSERAKKITQSITYFICKDLRPYNIVENEGFSYMIKTLEPRYVIPSRRFFADTAVPNLYIDVKRKVEESLSTAERVALTCDAWASRAVDSYVTITAHYLTADWRLLSYVLQTRTLHESHTGANIANLLQNAAQEWGIADKNLVVVTDNASNMTIATQLAGYLHVKCFAHTLNLASQRALNLPAVARVLGRVRRITGFFNRSTVANHALEQKQKMLQLPTHKLKTDVCTRWNSAYDMLQRFLEQQPAICAALLSPEVRKSSTDIFTLNEMDIGNTEEIVRALKSMQVATTVMSEEKNPTLSLVAPLLAQLLHDTQDNIGDTALVRNIKQSISQDLKKRYASTVERNTLYTASALDPRFKTLPFLSLEERQETYAREVAEAITLQEEKRQQPISEPEAREHHEKPGTPLIPAKMRKSCGLTDLLGQTYGDVGAPPKSLSATAEEEVKRYQEVTPLALTEDPLSWWKSHEEVYPFLATLAKRYLCIPGTSVSAERVFSTAGDIVTAKRSTLTSEHVDQLLFLSKNADIASLSKCV
ncbi:E3 SUMO-protein ligase ZBED1-like [Pelmatolapia mariae]|uniref:E3 SUMO-protein ligase ZBED1-like n=1 Tax=Pelmatolapia mariae TaxID=158779 RepID=UPI003211E473